jgi:hypothetical protein
MENINYEISIVNVDEDKRDDVMVEMSKIIDKFNIDSTINCRLKFKKG